MVSDVYLALIITPIIVYLIYILFTLLSHSFILFTLENRELLPWLIDNQNTTYLLWHTAHVTMFGKVVTYHIFDGLPLDWVSSGSHFPQTKRADKNYYKFRKPWPFLVFTTSPGFLVSWYDYTRSCHRQHDISLYICQM